MTSMIVILMTDYLLLNSVLVLTFVGKDCLFLSVLETDFLSIQHDTEQLIIH